MSRRERRHRFRAQVELPVTWMPTHEQEPIGGTVIDLSSSGARVVTSHCPTIGERGALTLQAAERGLDVVVFGRVVRVADLSQSGQRIWGVAFEGLDLPGQAALSRFVFGEAARRREEQKLSARQLERAAIESGDQKPRRWARGSGWYS